MKAETQRCAPKSSRPRRRFREAIAEAFRAGHLGVMDYYKLNNIKADTEMRGAIGSSVGPTATRSPPPASAAPPQ